MKTILLTLLLAVPVFGADFFVYRPASIGVVNRGRILRSISPDTMLSVPNKVENPDLSGLDLTLPMRWNGSAVVNLTPTQRQLVIDARAAQELLDIKTEMKALIRDSSRTHTILMRSLVKELVDYIDRRIASGPPETVASIRNKVVNTADTRINALTN